MDEFSFIDRSSTNAEKYTLREKLFGTKEVQPLWVADMEFATPHCVLDAVHERLKHPILGYEIMPDSAYEAQIEWFKHHHNFVMEREWLSYSPSVVASIGCAIRAFSEAGDEVIVMDPVYPPFYSMVRDNHRTLILHPLHQDDGGVYRFDSVKLRSQITPKTKLLLLCSPHNPVGRVWSREELMVLSSICLEYGIVIVSDEVHCDLVYEGYKHIPIASLSSAVSDSTITLMGSGKTFNMAGFSISTVSIASKELRERYAEEQHRLHWGDGAVLSHVAFEAAYRQGGEWHQKLIHHLDENRQRVVRAFENTSVTLNAPEGTYLAWCDCRGLGMGDRELREFFVNQAGVGLSAGLSFGREGSGFMRLNFALSAEMLESALEKITNALKRMEK